MMRAWVVLLTAIVCGAAGQSTYRCTTVVAPIVVDGELDSAEWGDAQPMALTAYLQPLVGDMQQGKLSQQQLLAYRDRVVYAKMLWDSDALYLGFWADNPWVWNELAGDDAEGYFRENTLEWFIDPDGNGLDYIECNFSTGGDISDALIFEPNKGGFDFDLDGMDAAARVHGTRCTCIGGGGCNADTDSGWALEVKLPFPSSLLADSASADLFWPDTLDALERNVPPPLTAASIENWELLSTVVADSAPSVVASMLAEQLDSAAAARLRAEDAVDAQVRDSLLAALNRLVTDVTLFVRHSAAIAVRDTVAGLGPVRMTIRTPLRMEDTLTVSDTTAPAWPLGDSLATVTYEHLEPDLSRQPETTFVAGCPLVDTIVEYLVDTVVLKAGGQTGRLLEQLATDGALVENSDSTYGLGNELVSVDSARLMWLNLALLQDLLLPSVVRHIDALRSACRRPIAIMGQQPLPPAPGNQWRTNLHCLATRPCSTYQVTYTWANVNDVGTAYHQTGLFGTIEFVGSPAGAVRNTHVVPNERMLHMRRIGRNRILVRLAGGPDRHTVRVSVHTLGGRLVAASALGPDARAAWRVRCLTPGVYILRARAAGASYRYPFIIE